MALEPITRAEQIMSGESLEPITREEMFIAKAAGMDVDTPTPITRREMFLSKISGGAGGGGGNSGGGSTEEWIGDGNTHIWITLNEGRTSPMLGVCPDGTVTVDWGDGTEPDVMTSTSVSVAKWTPNHEYAKAGDYVITLTVDGEMSFYGISSSNGYSGILRHSIAVDVLNQSYQCAVKKIEIGDGVTSIGQYAFLYCRSLASISIPDGVTSIGQYAFGHCYAMGGITIPSGVTSVGRAAFSNCYYITSFVIPSGVTKIENETFSNCYGARIYDFTKHTSIPALLSKNAFYLIKQDCEIRVPAALYDEWVAATNWTTLASNIVAV